MGIPIRNMMIASNSNNVLSEFFKTGEYDIGYRTVGVIELAQQQIQMLIVT